jgi:hypothetical protein
MKPITMESGLTPVADTAAPDNYAPTGIGIVIDIIIDDANA